MGNVKSDPRNNIMFKKYEKYVIYLQLENLIIPVCTYVGVRYSITKCKNYKIRIKYLQIYLFKKICDYFS